MGIVKLLGRDAVRLWTDASEREGRWAWTEALVVGEWPVLVPAPATGLLGNAPAGVGSRHIHFLVLSS